MANQKVYNIVINGIKESINELDILISKLDNIENRLDALGKQGIKLDTKGLKDLEKIKIPEISIEGIETKALKKEMQQLEKDIAKGAKTIDGEYTNTLNGLRAKLRDLKAELGTVDIDVDADVFADLTDEIKELNDQVKQMEQDYGTFARNVGNYTESVVDALNEFDSQMYETAGTIEEVKEGVDSLKGKQMFDVNIGGVAVQFENVSQAIGEIDDMAHAAAAKMQQLAAAGKQNTEEYKKLNQEFNEFIQTSANLERVRKQTDELRDSVASTSRGLDMGVQAFQALGNAMQMASGIAGLFGDNQEEIEKAINRTVQIQAILQAATELYNFTQNNAIKNSKLYALTIGQLGTAYNALIAKIGLGTKATKLFNATLKANIFVAIASAILYVATNLDKLSEILGLTNEDTKLFTDLWNKISPVIMGVGKAVTDFLINPLRTLVKVIANILDGNWKGAFEEIGKGVKEQFNIIEDYQKGYADEVENQAERATKKQKLELDKQLINDIKYNEAKYGSDWKYSQKGLELYRKYYANKLSMYKKDSDEYKEALLEQLNFEREVLEFGSTQSTNKVQIQRDIEDKLLSVLEDGNTKRMKELQLQRKRELEDAKERKKQGELSLKEYKEMESAINAEYDAKEIDEMNEHYNEVAKLQEEIKKTSEQVLRDNNIGYFSVIVDTNYRDIDKLNEQIQDYSKIWENNFDTKGYKSVTKDLLKGLNDGGENRKTLNGFQKFANSFKKIFVDLWDNIKNNTSGKILSDNLNETLNGLGELREKVFGVADSYTYLTTKTEDLKHLNMKMDISTDTIQSLKDMREFMINELQKIINDKNAKLNELEIQFENGIIDKDEYNAAYEQLNGYYKKLFDKSAEYYQKIYDNANKYSGKEIGVVVEMHTNKLKIESEEYANHLAKEDEYYKSRLELAQKAEKTELDNYILTLSEEEKANLSAKQKEIIIKEQKADIQKKYNQIYKNIFTDHYNKVEILEEEHQLRILDIEEETQRERSNIISRYQDAIYDEYRKYYETLEVMKEEYSNVDEVDLGSQDLTTIGGFSASILEMNKFSKSFKLMKDNIKKQKEELVQQFEDGVITEEAFNKSYAQLDQLESEVNDSLKGLGKSFSEWSVDIANIVNAAVGMWAQMYSQIADLQYQNEMYRIEKLKEEYDKETEILQEKLEEQEALYEKHNQNVSDIEGELQTARGDRRLFLLDQINSEMMKREQAWAQEQKIAKQQEQLQKKKDALEQRQKAAEQKRNKQNQKVQIAQATASTALAITNALAVQPWFLGVALAAVAAAMGAVQIATIAKQKFADGGVIQGASHANGGVKVLNGQAEVEGGEYITNKVTTSKNVDVLTFINSKKKKLDLSDFVEFYSNGSTKNYSKPFKTVFADGGTLPSMNAPMIDTRAINSVKSEDNRPIYVSVTEIENVQNKVRNVRAIAGLEN